jgi:Fic family protein
MLQWSPAALPLVETLRAPLGTRTPVGFESSFVGSYIPNQSSLLPPQLATDLYNAGRSRDQLPAGTYVLEVLEQLLIDLSWSSSRLEGNNKSLLDTKELFELGEQAGPMDEDTLMLLNHKDATEFMVDAVPKDGITLHVLVDLQSKLMKDLLKDSRDIGSIRRRVVNIDGSVYSPSNIPTLLEETLKTIIDKARFIRNPVEAAFFLWVNVAYLQPFADGNKRTSRLSANMPLMLYNCAPLSFLDVERSDYATAMLGVYEQRNVAAAVELFEFIYRRSIQKYSVLRASLSVPDPLRARYRQALNEIMQLVVFYSRTLDDAFFAAPIDAVDLAALRVIANTELDHLEQYNCARYNLARGMTQRWIDAGRPR